MLLYFMWNKYSLILFLTNKLQKLRIVIQWLKQQIPSKLSFPATAAETT